MLEYHSRVRGAVVALSLILSLVLLSSCKTPRSITITNSLTSIKKCVINNNALMARKKSEAIKIIEKCFKITESVSEYVVPKIAKQVEYRKLKDTLANMDELTEEVVRDILDLPMPSNAGKTVRQTVREAEERAKVIFMNTSLSKNDSEQFDLVKKEATEAATNTLKNIFVELGIDDKLTKKHIYTIVEKSMAGFSIRYIIEDAGADQGKDK